MILIRNACTIPGILIALVLGLSIAPVRAQSTLRYRFEQGQKLHYVVETKSVLSVSAGNLLRPRVDTTVTETIDLSWNVLSVNKQGLARIAQKVVRLRYAMDMPMGSTEYDSKASTDSEDPRIGGALSVLKALSAGELTLSMDSRGKISDIEVPKKVSECLKNALDRVGYAISPEDMLKLTFTSGILFLSAEPAPKGKSWIEKTTLVSPLGKMDIHNQITYDGSVTREGKKLEAFTLKLSTKEDPKARIKIKKAIGKGQAYFDNQAGWLVLSTLTDRTDVEGTAEGHAYSTKCEQTITLKLVDGN